jgi:hypothetical protein
MAWQYVLGETPEHVLRTSVPVRRGDDNTACVALIAAGWNPPCLWCGAAQPQPPCVTHHKTHDAARVPGWRRRQIWWEAGAQRTLEAVCCKALSCRSG